MNIRSTMLTAAASAGLVLGSSAAAQVGPTAHLTFDDAANLGNDISGNGNHAGLNSGPGYTASGVAGGAADLVGNSGYFSWVGEDDPVETILEGPLSFALWINTTQTGGGGDNGQAFLGQGIVWADVSGTPPGPITDTIPLALTGSKLGGFARSGTHINGNVTVNDGNWHHIAATAANNAGGEYIIYVDGIRDVATTAVGRADLSLLDALVLGGNTLDNRYFGGLLDDFQAYDFELNPAEIARLAMTPGQAITRIAGDANGDGNVDLADFVILRNTFGADRYAGFSTGDFNGDNAVDLQDFVILRNNFGSGDTAPMDAWRSTVPEPASLGLLAIGGMALIRRRR